MIFANITNIVKQSFLYYNNSNNQITQKENYTMELLQLKYFKTVAEMGKISDAAQALFISAPALSTYISRL